MNPEQGSGSRANEVIDEFLPELITDDEVLDLPGSNLTIEEKEERERDAYIQHLEDEVNDFASARPSYDLSPLRCCAHLLQLPIMKTLKDKDLVFYDLLDKVRKMVINFCKSVNAKGDLYEHVQLHMVSYVVICWLSDVDMMEWLVSTRRTTGSSTKSSPSQVWVGR